MSNIPSWCPLREREVKGLPDYREKEERVIAMIPDELKGLMDDTQPCGKEGE